MTDRRFPRYPANLRLRAAPARRMAPSWVVALNPSDTVWMIRGLRARQR